MRKFVLAGVALLFTVGLVLAAEVTFISYDKEKKELTVKDKDDKEMSYKVTDKTEFKRGDKDVPNDKGIEALEKMEMNDKAKGKAKIEIEADKKDVEGGQVQGREEEAPVADGSVDHRGPAGPPGRAGSFPPPAAVEAPCRGPVERRKIWYLLDLTEPGHGPQTRQQDHQVRDRRVQGRGGAGASS